ncbi:hypothetical protein [Echinicola vietnamensis]|uniref:Uncharacterized protein n=1 Tax=Echinicola vietnamensis (strain DSM 17526 / LMG 23754 / KMM 6221) TaxID=926556 RepID=L0FZ59_ECHVK|nr:hypothetical protein [Echinicola vietnamensis]AGA78572.1 hypothetical protein Echvi_2324 [Echinicola vietnamensis DSM 17526]
MGFLPIILTSAGFILLFGMVVSFSIKQKREQYKAALLGLRKNLETALHRELGTDLTDVEKGIQHLLTTGHPEASAVQRQLGRTKLLKHQYNQLIQTKPYSLVAKFTGQGPI